MTGWLILGPGILEFVYVGFTRATLLDNLGHEYIITFALAYFLVVLAVCLRRVIGQRRGEEIHTGEEGYSWLARMTPLPVWLCEIGLVPAVVVWTGYYIRGSFSAELGWRLMLCALSFILMATSESKRRWSQHRATVDDMGRVSGHEAQAQRRTTPDPDAVKPDGAELRDARKHRR